VFFCPCSYRLLQPGIVPWHTYALALQTKAKVEEIKYSGTGSLGSRRIVDEFESHLSEANAKCERNQQKYARNTVPKDDSKWRANRCRHLAAHRTLAVLRSMVFLCCAAAWLGCFRYERVAKILINVKAGVEHLADMLEPIKIGAPPMAMTDDTVVEVSHGSLSAAAPLIRLTHCSLTCEFSPMCRCVCCLSLPTQDAIAFSRGRPCAY
jgi:hypothetical protein